MKILSFRPLVLATLTGMMALTACAGPVEPLSSAAVAPPVSPVAQASASEATTELPLVVVHKSPSCGCCSQWADHMRQAGFPVEIRDQEDLNPIKQRLGVPYGKGSCHTAEVAGYFVEGHVPAEDIKRLLAQKPNAKGLVVPGMPIGSPGMEVPDGTTQPYTVELVQADGSTTDFAQH